MADLLFRGDSLALKQQVYRTFAGTWLVGETVTFTCNSKDYVYTLVTGDTTIATLVANLVTAFNALDTAVYPEFSGATGAVASQGSTTSRLYFTAGTAGVPFTFTMTTNSASGTISGETVVQASKGPNHWDDGDNWLTIGGTTGTAPASTDSVYLQNSSVDILYGIDNNSVTLTALHRDLSYTGNVGLPRFNPAGYFEYRETYLKISATTVNMGVGVGSGSGRFKLNVGSAQTTVNCYGTGSPIEDGIPTFLFVGTHASNVINLLRGSMGVCWLPGEVATVATIRIGYTDNIDSDSVLWIGTGATLTTINQAGGSLVYQSNVVTHTVNPGTATVKGSATITTLTIDAGTVNHNSTGTLTTLAVGNGGTIDFSDDLRTRTVTNTTLNAGSALLDPNKVVTFSNPITITRCGLSDLRLLDIGVNFTLARA